MLSRTHFLRARRCSRQASLLVCFRHLFGAQQFVAINLFISSIRSFGRSNLSTNQPTVSTPIHHPFRSKSRIRGNIGTAACMPAVPLRSGSTTSTGNQIGQDTSQKQEKKQIHTKGLKGDLRTSYSFPPTPMWLPPFLSSFLPPASPTTPRPLRSCSRIGSPT